LNFLKAKIAQNLFAAHVHSGMISYPLVGDHYMVASAIPKVVPEITIYEVGEPLPSAVKGNRATLPPDLKNEIQRLARMAPLSFLWQLLTTWLLIIGAVWLAIAVDHFLVSALVVVFVGTRQNVLALLMHEQCHRLAFRSRSGDLLCNLFVCYPLLLTLEDYRRIHLAHHQNYFTDRDPDYRRKQGEEWTFPQQVQLLLKSFLTDAFGLNFIRLLRGKGAIPGHQATKVQRSLTPTVIRVGFYVALASVLTAAHAWHWYLLFWILPLVTVLQVIVRWGAICEHKYNLVNPSVPESTPLIIPRWWEALLLPNLNFTYHIYHHWFPKIPFAQLPAVHRLFERHGLVNRDHVFFGYGSYLRHILGARRTEQPASSNESSRAPASGRTE
jgi:fatty acid desaturase